MNDDIFFKIFAVLVGVVFVIAACWILFAPRAKWSTDLPGATCAAHVGDKDYRCVYEGAVYLCIDNYSTHHIACGKVSVQP